MPANNRTIVPNLGALSRPKGSRLDAGSNTQGLNHISRTNKNRRQRRKKTEEEVQNDAEDLQTDSGSESSSSSQDESEFEVQPAHNTRLVKKKKEGSSVQAPSEGRGAKETKRAIKKVTVRHAVDEEPQTLTVLAAEGTVSGEPELDGTESQVQLLVEKVAEPVVQESNTPNNGHQNADQPSTRSPDGDDGQSASSNRNADALKGPGSKAKRGPAIRDRKTPKREHVAIIYPAEEGVTSSQTLNLIQSNVHPSKLCVGVKRVRHLRKGGLAVVTSTNQEVDKLFEVLTTEKGVREKVFVGRPKLQKPKIILYGVNEGVDLKEIPDLLKNSVN